MIRNLAKIGGNGLQKTLAVGQLVLEQFFQGDPEVWRDRRRNKDLSIRRLAAREDCPFSRSALNDAIGIYVATRETPSVLTFGHVSVNHIAAVLRLPPSEREAILKTAEEGRWSVRRLRESVRLRSFGGQGSKKRSAPLRVEPLPGRASAGAEPPRGQVSTQLSAGTLHALNNVAGTLALLAAAVRMLGEAGPIESQLRPDTEKLARDLLDARQSLLEIPILGC